MSVDVVCAGPPFLDLVFRGLPRLPSPGEEVLADDLSVTPGAMANVAFALRQLGLDAVVAAPIGNDPAGALLGALPRERGAGTLGALSALDLAAGDLVRIHDVRAAADFFTVRQAVRSGVDAELELRDDLRYDT